MGFLGTLVSLDALHAQTVGFGVAAATVGALLAALPGTRLTRRYLPGPRAAAYLVSCGTAAAVGLIGLALIPAMPSPVWKLVPLFLIGLAAGGSVRLSIGLVLQMLPTRRSASLLGLSGASFGLGGHAACLSAAAVMSTAASDYVLVCAASVPVLLAYIALRARRLEARGIERAPSPSSPSDGASPRHSLLAASFVLQAAACGSAACWLAAYLSRRIGFSGMEGAATMAVLWLALAVGWSLAMRMPPVLDDVLALGIPFVLAAVGAIALLWLPWSGVALLGAGLLGSGIGVLFPLTLRLARWPSAVARYRSIARSVQWSLPVALLVGWAVGALFFAVASVALVWGILACMLGSLAAISLVIGDYRISGDPAVN